jgi:hypothetical protein
MSPPNQETQKDRQTWFALISLVQECPASIGGVKIMGATRQVLMCVALHANGETCETFVERDTIMDECAITHNTLDDSLADLREVGLLSSRTRYNGVRRSNILILNRERLIAVARPERIRRSCVKALKKLRRWGTLTWEPIEPNEVVAIIECLERLSKTPLQIRQAEGSEDGRRVIVLTITRHLMSDGTVDGCAPRIGV